jgi:hypothetical protein
MGVMEIKPRTTYLAILRIRRRPDWRVRPECERLDGKQIIVRAEWLITAEDREQYAGEWAMSIIDPPDDDLPAWLSSGDMTILGIVEDIGPVVVGGKSCPRYLTDHFDPPPR